MLTIKELQHQYEGTSVLNLPEWTINEGTHWLLLGKSGCGKTTLLHIIAGLLKPTHGVVYFDEMEISRLSAAKMDTLRAKKMGFIFQKPHLISSLSILKNLLLTQFLQRNKPNKNKCLDVLDQLRIADKSSKYPHQLSQGELQRVSVARAILNRPAIILADEPTASLDDENANTVIRLLKEEAEKLKAILIIATHDKRVKEQFHHIKEL